MAETRFDVLTIGNAIVDVIAPIEEGFLSREGLTEGIMHLVDAERSAYLYDRMPADKRQISGGSAGNTAAGVASLGGRAAFIGKVADDDLGDVFAEDLKRIGVHYGVSRLTSGPVTASSMILLSPDGERTMNTHLGACHQLTTADIKEDEIGGATVTYMEGFLWDPTEAKKAFVTAAHYAHKHERAVSFTLSDPFCVNRYREEFLDLIRSKTVDIVFGNIEELKALYQADFHGAVQAIAKDAELAAITMGAEGAMVVCGRRDHYGSRLSGGACGRRDRRRRSVRLGLSARLCPRARSPHGTAGRVPRGHRSHLPYRRSPGAGPPAAGDREEASRIVATLDLAADATSGRSCAAGPLVRTRSARLRVGRILSRRLGRLISVPGPHAESFGFFGAHLGEAVEEALGVSERRLAQAAEALHEPGA